MKKLALLLSASILLSACTAVGGFVSDDVLKEKAAFALDTTADKVSISNRNNGSDAIKFVATTRGRSHQCYVTTVASPIIGLQTSDAICSGAGSATGSTNCNALSRRAGRCH